MNQREGSRSCKGCGKLLGDVQIQDMARAQTDPGYSRWCREGYCLHSCWEIHQESKPNDGPSVHVELPLGKMDYYIPATSSARIQPRPTAGTLLFWLVMGTCWCLLGIWLINSQVTALCDRRLLRAGGQLTLGGLQNVTKHRTNFILTGRSFGVDYAGTSKEFYVNGKVFAKHTLPDSRFVRHPIAVVFLPDRPSVAELSEMLAMSELARCLWEWLEWLFPIIPMLVGVFLLREFVKGLRKRVKLHNGLYPKQRPG